MKVDGGKNPRVVEMTRKEILEEKKIGYAGIKLDFDLTSQEKSMIKGPVLDSCGSLESAVNLIIRMREVNNMNNYHHTPSFCLADLKEFREAPPNSDRWKVAKAAKNNGDLLTKSFSLVRQKYLAESEKLKNLVINNLEWWILDSSFLRNAKSKPLKQGEIGDIDVNCLTPEHFQEIRNLMIKNIRETATEWKIVKSVGWLDEETGEEWYVELVLENIEKPHRRFNIRTFTKQEWEEIKRVVKNHQCKEQEEEHLRQGRWEEPDLPPAPSKTPEDGQRKNNQVRANEKNLFSQMTPFLIGGGTVLIAIAGIWVIYRKRKKRN